MIPYLLSKQPQTENDSFTCKLDSGLFSLALSNTIHFASFLIVLTYMGVKHSDYLEKKEKCLKWALSLITWGISGTGGIFLSIYAEKTTTDDLVCWIVSDAAIITYFLVTLVYMLIVLVLLFIIKKKLKAMTDNREIEESKYNDYTKSFNNCFIFAIYVICNIFVDFLTEFTMKNYDKESMTYFIVIFCSCLLNILIYPIIVYLLCFIKMPLSEVIPCYKKKEISDGTLINLIEN